MKAQRSDHATVPSPRELHDHLDRFVIGQERAKRALALAAYGHLRRAEAIRRGFAGSLRKSNVLLVGPTGSGKTLLARHLATAMRAPFATADATEFTEAGYYGKDVELMLSDLLAAANQSVEDAERGVVFLDEVDKLARRSQGASNGAGARDIGGEGVQQALLKMLEGHVVQVPPSVSTAQPWARHEAVALDTTHVLFICAGTFTDLHAQRSASRRMGFGANEVLPPSKRIHTRELVAFGMLQEFLGRLPVVVELEDLGAADLLRVLTEPADSLVEEFRTRLALDGVDLAFRVGALREIVHHALARGVGARGLRAMLEEVCSDVLFEGPALRGRRIVVDTGYVRRRLRDFDAAGRVD